MNRSRLLKKNGWITLYSVITAFLMLTFSLVLINVYVSNLRIDKSMKDKNYLDIKKSNIKKIVKASIAKYLYSIKQDIVKQYPKRSNQEFFNKFESKLLGSINDNLSNIMLYKPLLDKDFQNSNMEMSYKLHYDDRGGMTFQSYMGSLKFDIDIVINSKGEDVIEECIFTAYPNFQDDKSEVKVEIEKFQ